MHSQFGSTQAVNQRAWGRDIPLGPPMLANCLQICKRIYNTMFGSTTDHSVGSRYVRGPKDVVVEMEDFTPNMDSRVPKGEES